MRLNTPHRASSYGQPGVSATGPTTPQAGLSALVQRARQTAEEKRRSRTRLGRQGAQVGPGHRIARIATESAAIDWARAVLGDPSCSPAMDLRLCPRALPEGSS